NFTNTDALVNAVGSMEIYGHTLGWHQNQNATYLKNYAGITIPAAVELLGNPGFEGGLTGWNIFNSGNPAGTSTLTHTTATGEFRTGAGALRVVNPTAYPGSQWRVQLASNFVTLIPGRQYIVSYWVRAASAGGSIRLSTAYGDGGSSQFQGDQTIGTAWQQINWTITANSSQFRMVFDMGQAANTYFIDDASVKEVVNTPSGPQIALKLDTALRTFILGTVNRYKNKVRAWDVVNELFADNPAGALRTNLNTSNEAADVLVWTHYMGRDFALKAFNYAREADPTADLYINDYNLESSARKLDSLIAFVDWLKTNGAKVDGIGTQMHIDRRTSYAGIDDMFKKLAATGLKIRVTELDVRTILGSAAGGPTPELLAYQAVMYRYVVSSYLKHIPKAQQAGITVWGVNDANSWLYRNGTEFPLLYDNDYNKKPAYGAFLQGLKNQ
ncbi:MAG TPA: endo-1,4-beta-xylanase, partial [Lacibacter sp.]|nr:endo-1,4-beta-xylanase [Lacibacter sp.]